MAPTTWRSSRKRNGRGRRRRMIERLQPAGRRDRYEEAEAD